MEMVGVKYILRRNHREVEVYPRYFPRSCPRYDASRSGGLGVKPAKYDGLSLTGSCLYTCMISLQPNTQVRWVKYTCPRGAIFIIHFGVSNSLADPNYQI